MGLRREPAQERPERGEPLRGEDIDPHRAHRREDGPAVREEEPIPRRRARALARRDGRGREVVAAHPRHHPREQPRAQQPVEVRERFVRRLGLGLLRLSGGEPHRRGPKGLREVAQQPHRQRIAPEHLTERGRGTPRACRCPPPRRRRPISASGSGAPSRRTPGPPAERRASARPSPLSSEARPGPDDDEEVVPPVPFLEDVLARLDQDGLGDAQDLLEIRAVQALEQGHGAKLLPNLVLAEGGGRVLPHFRRALWLRQRESPP